LGQVASQTLPALSVVDTLAEMPVLRPLIGMDKEDIIAISRKIDTFEISIQPYEDCCTVFTPKHPRTRPTIEQCEKAEQALDIDALIERAIAATEYSYID
jgi:thiamine biosynthesis protein ThiI